MSKMAVDADKLYTDDLLPVEEIKDVNGIEKAIPIGYLAEIVSILEKPSKKGDMMAVIKFAIDNQEKGRVYIEDYFPYPPSPAKFKLANLIAVLELDPKTLDTDDFLGQMVIMNIQHQEYAGETKTGEKFTKMQNKIATIVRRATAEEVGAKPQLDGGEVEAPKF